jgi:hypothetical protein
MTKERRVANGEAKAVLTPAEILAVQGIVQERGLRGATAALQIARATVFRIIARFPVSTLTASHLRSKLVELGVTCESQAVVSSVIA